LSTQERKDIQLSPAAFACPPGKVLNPKTNRCVKIKTQKITSLKKYPPGKELNPKTNRCIKIKTQKRRYFKKTA